MSQYKGSTIETLKALETAPSMYLILSPELYILTASNLYLQATETSRETITGKHIFEAFPDNPELPDADGVQNINASLQTVLRTKQPDYMTVQRYDVPNTNQPGKFIQRYWAGSHTPVLNKQGEIQYIIQLVINVTQKVLTEQALLKSQLLQQQTLEQVQSLNEALSASNEELQQTQKSLHILNNELEERIAIRTRELSSSEAKFKSLIAQSPIAMKVFRGNDMTFEIVNKAMLLFLGKDESIIGKPLFVGVPEIVGQPIVERLYQVYKTGKPLELRAEQILLHRNGKAETGYYDIIYRALYDDSRITGVLGIVIDVTEQKQDEHRKNDFIGMVSHELKTPLTSLSAFVQMLHSKAKTNNDVFTSGALYQVTKQVKKMTAMINSFLNNSQLASGKINLNLERFDMEELIKEVEVEVSLSLQTHTITFQPCNPAYVNADRDKISQVITNLLSNAVKYSPKDKPIEVACYEVNGTIQLSVKDEGIGISAQDIGKLFQRYFRASTVNPTISGFGIGLYLCAEIIHRHQGSIWVESELGKGSTFNFKLSLS
ncbi:MAG: PAS domain-containing protein [Sphingobacteriaceae bacterium]|nr:MAG: PAS domain-containing protein [Sphingobacteriaceae bacterium]